MMLPEGDEQDSFGAVFLERGQGDVLATRAPLDLFVFADSHRSARVRDVRDGQEIVLSGGLELRIRLPRDTPAPTAPFWLSVVLLPDDPSFDPQSYFELRGENRTSSMNGSVPWADMLVAKLGSDGTALLRLPEPGRYTVHWDLHRTQGGLEREERVEFQETVEVRDQAGEQAWTSGITPRMLTKAREKF
jgi:hypothetical protein